MQHILFSLITAFIGFNILVVSGAQEQNPVTFDDLGVQSIMAKENSPTPFQILPLLTHKKDEVVSSYEEKREPETPSTDNGAYNIKSEKEVSASVQGVAHSPVLIPCSDDKAACEPTVTQTPSPALTPTGTPTPTPTNILVASPAPIDPPITITLPEEPPVCNPGPIKDNPRMPDICLY